MTAQEVRESQVTILLPDAWNQERLASTKPQELIEREEREAREQSQQQQQQ